MREFLYPAKYGESKRNKRTELANTAERDWKDMLKIVCEANVGLRHKQARIQSTYMMLLITKNNETLKMVARVELKMTKVEVVRDWMHPDTVG
jgi:hypothetical protein